MKRRYLIFIFSIITATANAQSDAGSYLDYIGNQYQEISKDMMSYTSAVNHGKSARKVEKRRGEVLAQLKEGERNVRNMKPFQNDSKLRDSVVSYLRISQIVLNQDYGKILNLEDIAEQSYDAMEAYLLAKEKAGDKLDEAAERVSVVYKKFAADNRIKLIENDSKLSQKMEAAHLVNEYYNKVYLLFFKSYKNEAYCLDGLQRNDVNAAEQAKNSLLASATEDLAKLGQMQAFQGDASLKAAAQQALAFYKKEASDYIPASIDFQLKKDNFQKMDKAFNAKKQGDLTQAEIDAFNKAVGEYNAGVKKINALNDQNNKARQIALDKWSSASENFLDSHTPKYR
ncbi:MAG TPA: hypothetical protein VG737_05875 [Cyclobacteriaceae bacterium]|nr:hypothetical protein [Cyclobacteriaceae bacterium]